MKYIYGPVKSRRLGLSLGVTLTPYKICSFNCVYCQLGKTEAQTRERKEYVQVEEIISELRLWLQNNEQETEKLDYITFSGSGEPTLNIKIGELIAEIKKITSIPLAVITNASLLNDPLVRKELLGADLIVPSLNAITLPIFQSINRPQNSIDIKDIINGLMNLRREFLGKIWLEIMLVKGLNDGLGHIRKIKEFVDKINPDKIQLNSPVRSTTESDVFSVDKKRLEKFREILGDRCEVI
ncbi:MAG: radical SAM protein [Candidatus Omnitrophica bacterium]|nr:radical SAM protein [Candidatus Omnitrophota bacterium]